MRPEELAARIEAERRSLRPRSLAWCPTHTQHLVAAVYMVDGQPTLWLRGGRSGSHTEMAAEFEQSRRDALHHVRDVIRTGRDDLLADAVDAADTFSDLLDETREHRYPAVAPPMAHRITSSSSRPRETVAACSRCKRDLIVSLGDDGVLTARHRPTVR